MKIVRRIAALLLAAALSAALLCPAALADETSGRPEKAAPEITLSQTSAVMAAGDTLQLTARVSDGQDVTWQSLTTAVASVDETGLVTALSEGRVVIRATAADGSVFANCTINVSMAFPSYSLRVGEKRLPAVFPGRQRDLAQRRFVGGFGERLRRRDGPGLRPDPRHRLQRPRERGLRHHRGRPCGHRHFLLEQ